MTVVFWCNVVLVSFPFVSMGFPQEKLPMGSVLSLFTASLGNIYIWAGGLIQKCSLALE